MEEPAKPFACTLPDCGMTFTNEDHLHVHTKKHDMVLQLGSEQKAAFVADQTPTPTRFIRNCEEVGLFQDLQNVNPFDEGFKRAMDMKHNMLTLESTNADDVLHTPQMVYPAIDNPDCTLYSNNQRNITISRSSSDETSAVKGYETTTISRLTNEVTTISRVVEKPDPLDKSIDKIKDNVANKTISYTNNVIEISNIEIRKDISDNDVNKAIEGSKEKANNNEIVNVEVPKPIMSQKSIDYVVEALTSDLIRKDNSANNVSKKKIIKSRKRSNIDYQVTLTLPNGKTVKMKAADEDEKPIQDETKEKLKTIIRNNTAKKQKPQMPVIQNVVSLQNIPTATLIPVKIVNTVGKVPILPFKIDEKVSKPEVITGDLPSTLDVDNEPDRSNIKRSGLPSVMECRSAASRRYRQRSKQQMLFMTEEIKRLTESNKNLTESNKKLTESNKRLTEEMSKLKMLTVEHMKKCPIADDLRNTNPEKTKPDSINIQR